MFEALLATAAALYGTATVCAWCWGRLEGGPYPSPAEADAELDRLAEAYPSLCRVERYGHSGEGRPLRALRIGRVGAPARVLVTGQIHAVEFVSGFVARALARAALECAESSEDVRSLLSRAQLVVAPLLNPDGAERVWRSRGWVGVGAMRHTSAGVDPNRNFPFEGPGPKRGWNSGRSRRGTAYYRGPEPLSEPECQAVAQLAASEPFCAAVHFHSFGAVVFQPALEGVYDRGEEDPAARGLAAFGGAFRSRQRFCAYRVIEEPPAVIAGQLDAYLLGAFGTPSVTVEVSKPGLRSLWPSRLLNPFWLSNPDDPSRWAANDVEAALHALRAMLDATGGVPGAPRQPALGRQGSPSAGPKGAGDEPKDPDAAQHGGQAVDDEFAPTTVRGSREQP
jgi:hypothetical protein